MAKATRSTLSATTLIGDNVKNSKGEDLGSVKDIMMDVDRGKIAYAVVSYGGILGLGDKLFAVPWNALRLDESEHSFVFDVDKETLKNAEGFDKDHWPDMTNPTWGAKIHAHYGTRPYWE
jgi:sporulation protein YlmC with PRC-barrel domain